MKPNQTRDTAVGVFVLAGLAAIAYLSLQLGGVEIRATRRSESMQTSTKSAV